MRTLKHKTIEKGIQSISFGHLHKGGKEGETFEKSIKLLLFTACISAML